MPLALEMQNNNKTTTKSGSLIVMNIKMYPRSLPLPLHRLHFFSVTKKKKFIFLACRSRLLGDLKQSRHVERKEKWK